MTTTIKRFIAGFFITAVCFCLTLPAWAEKRIDKDLDEDGRMDQMLIYDDSGTIQRIETDNDHDGFAERRQFYEKGLPVRIERDLDNDQKIDCMDYIENEKRARQEKLDPKGRIIQISFFDEKGQVKLIKKDTTNNQQFDTLYHFIDGKLSSSTKDTNEDGTPDIITRFKNTLPAEQEKDSNFDGRFDIKTWFSNSLPKRQEKDTDFDGKTDYFAEFDKKGQLAKTREQSQGSQKINRVRFYRAGELYRIEEDHDLNGFFETVSLMENQKIVKTMIDKNQDGKPDTDILFTASQEKKSLASDSDFDGKKDVWQFYENNLLVKFEKDGNKDSKPDLRVMYKKGEKISLARDADFDGYFEILQTYTDPQWTMVMTQDVNGDKVIDVRSFYTGAVLRKTEIDEDSDGIMDLIEFHDQTGALEKVEESTQGKIHLTWFYGPDKKIIRGEEDKNRDGKTDIWYFYSNGILTTVEEDTNLDGKPDLWESYDETQAVVKREKDLDFDGTPDFVDVVENADVNS